MVDMGVPSQPSIKELCRVYGFRSLRLLSSDPTARVPRESSTPCVPRRQKMLTDLRAYIMWALFIQVSHTGLPRRQNLQQNTPEHRYRGLDTEFSQPTTLAYIKKQVYIMPVLQSPHLTVSDEINEPVLLFVFNCKLQQSFLQRNYLYLNMQAISESERYLCYTQAVKAF